MDELLLLKESIDQCVGLFSIDERADEKTLKELEPVLQQHPHIQWIGIISSRFVHHPLLQQLIVSSTFDFHSLPIDHSLLRVSMGHALGMAHLWHHVRSANAIPPEMSGMIGISPAMDNIRDMIRIFSATSAPVLITGESGTGKEIVARSLHQQSGRASGPFVAVNCGALPEGLVHSELFGHKKGSFTGAMIDKEGKVEAAHGGTLFLDEVGDLPKSLQVHLLRFLQEGTIEKLGTAKTIQVDVRIIAATNVDLSKAVSEGKFREDLFYRLNVLRIPVPPLRERPEDVPLLADHYLRRYRNDGTGHIRGFSLAAYDHLARHSWPGNVRELINCVRHAILVSRNRLITPVDLGLPSVPIEPLPRSLSKVREAADKRAIEATLRFTGNNVSAASRVLNISRLSLYRLIEKYEVDLVRNR